MKAAKAKRFGLLLLLVSGTLVAQPAQPAQPTPAEDPAALSAKVTLLTRESTANTNLVIVLQIKARRDKDVIRLNCINDKLIQIKSLRNILDDARRGFEVANSPTEQNTMFKGVEDAANSIRILRDEARTCAGEFQVIGDQKNDWDGPDIPDDPSKDWFPDDFEPPAYASPYN